MPFRLPKRLWRGLKESDMRMKELLANREKLAQYDELKEWKESFHNMVELPMITVPPHCIVGLNLPPHIKKIIVDALEAEIKKLDEE